MPGKIKVKVLAGRNLPVMDRAGDTTDAFVEIKFGGVTHKTDVCRKSLNPQWNSTEWYRFEVDESELQDEPLQLRLMDHDTYSANDAIGKVVISLAPLLAREANNAKAAAAQGGAVMSGWIPVFDTMHGIRGELNVIVKVELFSDFNKYKTSSCGVQFFHCPMIPPGYRASAIHGFVEELVVNDDPEYQWIDKIRTPRASNEARQVAFIKLSNQVQRLVGLKAAELGANAVVGYQQDFDLEGEAGVVARAIGTAVSITPLPTPSQTSNVPPCTQQQLKKYLDILATDDESITDLNQYYQTHQDELQKLLIILNPKAPSLLDETDNVEDDEKSILTRQSSIKSYAGTISIYQDDYISQKSLRHIADDQTELNRLLNRGDDDEETQGPLKKIKKFKTSFFLKRLGNMRSSRKSDASKQDDTVSIKSNSSDTSRISLVDLKNEIKKFKRIKKPKYRKAFTNDDDEGVGMASILARSVMHAHTSLACIAETQDTDQSPNSTLRRTSESEPTINIEDDQKAIPKTAVSDSSIETEKKNVPEIRFTSMKNISCEVAELPEVHRKLSESCPSTPIACRNENLLKLPGEAGYFGSVSSALSDSSEIYTSSEEDDESSDQKTDTDKSFETPSSVVHYLMNNEVNPALIAQMDKKLSTLESLTYDKIDSTRGPQDECFSSTSSDMEAKAPVGDNNKCVNPEKCILKDTVQASTSTETDHTTFVAPKSSNHQFKFHNPFTHKKSHSVSAPSSPVESKSFVYRSSKRIKRQLSKLSKSSMIKSLSHYSLIPKKKVEPKTAMSQPGSGSDITSKAPSETVLGSPFLSYADLLSLDKEDMEKNKVLHKSDEFGRPKVSMYIGSEPVSRASLSGTLYPEYGSERRHSEFHHKKEKPSLKPTGLVHTAMETILIDKVQSLMIPTSPDPVKVNKSFFDDVTEKLEKVEDARMRKSESTGLIHTAMETILMDKVQSLITPNTPDSRHTNKFFQEEMQKNSQVLKTDSKTQYDDQLSYSSDTGSYLKEHFDKGKHKDTESSGLIHTAMETILMDKVQSLFTAPMSFKGPSDHSETKIKHVDTSHQSIKDENESTGLINTAVKTILMDKVQSLVDPNAIESETPRESVRIVGELRKNQGSTPSLAPSGLINTAVQTILMDKVQSLIDPNSIEVETPKDKVKNDHEITETSPSLIDTAMKTILIDKVQSLIDPNTIAIEQQNENVKIVGQLEKSQEPSEISSGLINTAVKTILIDKVQSLIDTSNVEIKNTNNSEDKTFKNEPESSGLVNTAMKTMLMDKVQALIDPNMVDIDKSKKSVIDIEGVTGTHESSSLTPAAMESILVNKVQSLFHHANEDEHKTAKPSGMIKTAMETMLVEKAQSLLPDTESSDTRESSKHKLESRDSSKDRRLIRQNSVHSDGEESLKVSKVDRNPARKVVTPVLQHFHPILSGPQLETIPSLPESFDRTESLDVEGVGRDCNMCETNNASVCGNSHAACGVGRCERDRERERDRSDKDKGSPRHARHESYGGREPVAPATQQNSSLNSSSTPMGIHRRSSDSDLSVTPKGSSLNTSGVNTGSGGGAILRPSMNSNNLEMLEYPFLTMTEYPPGFIVHIGGTVCARSVKLVDGGGESAARAAWWAELRTELRAHARALRCNAVLAYQDTAAICEDVCVLSASGTAAVINLDCDFNADIDSSVSASNGSKNTIDETEAEWCSTGHVPYSPGAPPYRAELSTCGGCRRARVPAVLLATCSKPSRLASYPKAVTLTAVAARTRRAAPGSEPGARDISDQLPFLEYELHKLLLAKLRMQGANALFNLQTQIAIGERVVMALASGTAVRLTALPPPSPPRIKASENDKEALEIQKALWESFTANKAANGFEGGPELVVGALPEVDTDAPPPLDLCADKDACVLELDEAEDVETARALARRGLHGRMPVFTSALTPLASAPPYAFVQVWRGKVSASSSVGGIRGACERQVGKALDALAYKLRRLQPAALLTASFSLDLPEDEVQLVVSGAAVRLRDPNKPDTESACSTVHSNGSHGNGTGDADDDIFALDEDQLVKSQHSETVDEKPPVNIIGQAPATVSLTTVCQVAGARWARRVCALRLLFVRETTSVRELGGLSGFLHTFTCEVLAIARAYTAALGGNALTSFYITQLMLQDNAHKNQGQCLLSVGGDVVHITY